MEGVLNERARCLTDLAVDSAEDLRIAVNDVPGGGRVLDFGVDTPGGLAAGLTLAEICMSGLADIRLVDGHAGELPWPSVQVATDHPVAACLLSQYAGWQISVGKYFAMGSGPMRAAAAREELFGKLDYSESTESVVGTLETSQLPGAEVFEQIAEKTNVAANAIELVCAPVSSQAGNVQVVARSVETALHKLFELGFDVNRVQSGFGVAPLPPVAKDDLTGIGRTNDAILYGGAVTLWVSGDDGSLEDVGPRVPSDSSAAFGKPFLEVFEEAGRDFYKIDPHLFSPATVTFQNLETGNVFRFGKLMPEILRTSFGLHR